ncbi:MAG: hypothetical protein ACM37W_24370 [Actinomycetota bacterium]
MLPKKLIFFMGFLLTILNVSISVKAVAISNDFPLKNSVKIAQKMNRLRAIITLEDLQKHERFEEIKNLPPGQFRFVSESQIISGSNRLLSNRFAEARPRFTQEHWQQLRKVLQQQCSISDEDLSEQVGIQIKTLESNELPLPQNIGDLSFGKTRRIEINGIRPLLDQVLFIRGNVMATIIVLYFEGDVSAISTVDIARKLDTRIQQNLQ